MMTAFAGHDPGAEALVSKASSALALTMPHSREEALQAAAEQVQLLPYSGEVGPHQEHDEYQPPAMSYTLAHL